MPNKIGDHLHALSARLWELEAMKIYRGFPNPIETDSTNPDEYISTWKRGKPIYLKGAKTRQPERSTALYLEIEEFDVIALFYALLERYERKMTIVSIPSIVRVCVEANSRLAHCLSEVVCPQPLSERRLKEALANMTKLDR
jgi:hypothetical protein